MTIKPVSSLWRWVTWCLLASVCIASMEAAGFLLTHGPEDSLSLGEFAQQFSNTCGVMFIVMSCAWVVVWFLLVWLGGIRAGIGLLLVVTFFMVLDLSTVWVDVLVTYSGAIASYASLLSKDCFAVAVVLSGGLSLVAARFTRGRPVNVTTRGMLVLAVLATTTAVSLWLRGSRLPDVPAGLFWGAYGAGAAVLAGFVWWLGKKPLGRECFAAVCAVGAFSPLVVPFVAPQLVQDVSPPAAPVPVAEHAIKHVVLITIDTLRQDALGCYNGGATDTPRINELASESLLFTQAYSCAPWTYPSVASILTGLAPHVHQLIDGRTKMPENVPSLAQYLARAGYRTTALGYNSVLLPRSGFDRGFQEYAWFPIYGLPVKNFEIGLTQKLLRMAAAQKPDTRQLTETAIQWFRENGKQDSFFWLHYFDPHIPYMPPQEYLPADPKLRSRGSFFWDVKLGRGGGVARTAEDRAWIRALYDGEVRYVDSQVGRFLDALRQLGIYDDALIVLAADHGEELWDHGRFEHGHTLYNELLRVPLLVKLPAKESKTVEVPVSTQAIAPTVLSLCGIAPNDPEVMLRPLTQPADAQQAAQPVFSGATLFNDPSESVIFGDMKYIRQTVTGHEMLFNLKDDPKELNSVAAADAVNLEKGRQLLDAGLQSASQLADKLGIRKDQKEYLDPRDILSLQALGYL